MKHIVWAMLVLSSTALAQSAESITSRYVAAYAAGRFDEAAALIYCSDELSEIEIASKRKGLEKELAFMRQEFGRIATYEEATSSLYLAASLGCAPHKFLKTHPPQKTVIFDITHPDSSKSYIVLSFIIKQGRMLPIMVSYGVSQTQPGAAERIKRVYQDLLKL